MFKPFHISLSKKLLIGLCALFLQLAANAQEETVIDNKGNIITVRNNLVTTSTTAPLGPVQNDIWFDTTANLTKIYDGSVWLVINADALALKEDALNKSTDGTLAGNSNIDFPTEQAVKTYVDAFQVTDVLSGNKIATVTEANGTAVEIDETITTLETPMGMASTLRYTSESGTVDIPNIVRSVNGVNPAANGNVAVILSSTSTGLEADLPATAVDSDIYIVTGEVAPNADRNGVAFIYDDVTGWQEVTTDLSTNDARYVNVIGDAMTGPLAMGSNSVTGLSDPVNLQDAATKNYVDGLANGDITSSDLTITGGTDAAFNNVSLAIAPSAIGTIELADGAATTAKIATDAIDNTRLSDNAVQTENILNGAANQILRTNATGDAVEWANLPSSQNIYTDNGTLAGNRILDANGNSLDFTNVDGGQNIVGATTGVGETAANSSDGALLHIRQETGWSGLGPWALYVEGYTNLNGFRINAADGVRSLYTRSAQLGFATQGNVPITFTQNSGDTRVSILPDGELRFHQYGSGTITGTETKLLGVESDGHVVEVDLPSSGTVSTDTGNSLSTGTDSGIFYESPIKAFGKISAAGTVTRATPGVTVTKLAGNGRYRVNLPATAVSDANYIIQLTQPGRGGAGNDDPGISYNNQTATGFEVIIGDNDNGGTDRARFNSEFMFTILDM